MTEEGHSKETWLLREVPYITAGFIFVLAVAAALLMPNGPPGQPASGEPLRMDLTTPAGKAAVVFAIALFAGGLACLAVLLVRAVRGRPLVAQRPVSPTRWNWWDLVKVVVVQQVLYVLLLSLAAALGWDGEEAGFGAPDFLMFMAASFGASAVALRVVLSDRRGTWASLGLTFREWKRCAAIGAGAFVAFWPVHIAVAWAGAWALEHFQIHLPEQAEVRLMAETQDVALLLAVGLHALVVAPIVEEFFFRALLLPLLERRMRGWLAAGLSAAVFAAAHGNARATVPIFLLGWALAYVYQRTRSLVAPVVFHAAFNAVTILGIFVIRAGHVPG